MYCTGRCTTHCIQLQNKILNSIQEDALHSTTEQAAELNSGRCTVPVAALHTALEYRIRYWTQFRDIHCTRRRSTPHCTRIQNKILNLIQEEILNRSQHLHTALEYRTRYWTEFKKIYCTSRSTLYYTPIQNKMLNSIQEDALYPVQHFRTALEYRTKYWTEFRKIYCTCRSTLHCTPIQNKILNWIQEDMLYWLPHFTLH